MTHLLVLLWFFHLHFNLLPWDHAVLATPLLLLQVLQHRHTSAWQECIFLPQCRLWILKSLPWKSEQDQRHRPLLYVSCPSFACVLCPFSASSKEMQVIYLWRHYLWKNTEHVITVVCVREALGTHVGWLNWD